MNQEIYYIFYGRYPSEKAHALFVNKTCEAYQKLGYNVTLLVPDFGTDAPIIAVPFSVKRFSVSNFRQVKFFKKFTFYIAELIFMLKIKNYLKQRPASIVFSNDELAVLATSKKDQFCYELHDFPEKNLWWYRWLFGRFDALLVTNRVKLELLNKHFPNLAAKQFVEPNGVDVEQFSITTTKAEAREKLNLPSDTKIILYTGHLYDWKGVDTLAEAAKLLPDECLVYFVGGTPKDVSTFTATYGDVGNIKIIGHRPHDEMPLWQKAADVLVIPNTAKQAISKFYTSPMKLFEYMSSERPIIASRIPSIQDIVDERLVTFFTPDDPNSLAEAIKGVLAGEVAEVSKENVKNFLEHYSWIERAKRILKEVTN